MNKNDKKDNKVKIYTRENIRELKEIPILEDGQIYIYCLLSSNGNIKIGKTTNIVQRITSLSGSNGAGSHIKAIYCSPSTYMSSMEHICQDHYNDYRIPSTEWFNGEFVRYIDVVQYIDELFHSIDFTKCNEVRKQFIESIFKEKKDENQ